MLSRRGFRVYGLVGAAFKLNRASLVLVKLSPPFPHVQGVV